MGFFLQFCRKFGFCVVCLSASGEERMGEKVKQSHLVRSVIFVSMFIHSFIVICKYLLCRWPNTGNKWKRLGLDEAWSLSSHSIAK